MYQVLNLWLCYSSDMNALMHLFLKLLIYSLKRKKKLLIFHCLCQCCRITILASERSHFSVTPLIEESLPLVAWGWGHLSAFIPLNPVGDFAEMTQPNAEQLWNNHSGFLSCMIFKCLMLMENATFSCCNHVETYRACVKAYGYIGYFNLDSWFVSKLNPN